MAFFSSLKSVYYCARKLSSAFPQERKGGRRRRALKEEKRWDAPLPPENPQTPTPKTNWTLVRLLLKYTTATICQGV